MCETVGKPRRCGVAAFSYSHFFFFFCLFFLEVYPEASIERRSHSYGPNTAAVFSGYETLLVICVSP